MSGEFDLTDCDDYMDEQDQTGAAIPAACAPGIPGGTP
jgi:hypothetical protein